MTKPPGRPIQVGDVLARFPVGRVIAGDLWPQISILRPHTQTWHLLVHELRDLESWVRRIAVPILITGSTDVTPMPPPLDITVGYTDVHAALEAASPVPAADRLERLLHAEMAREGPRNPEHASAWQAARQSTHCLGRRTE